MKAYDTFKELSACADRVYFKFKTDHSFQGWVSDVREDSVLVMWQPSPMYAQATGTKEMAPPDEWIKFEDIDLSTVTRFGADTKSTQSLESSSCVKKWWQFWR